ncbi:MAG TPA: glycosyltransferase family 39 protein [Vicinamibacteria bacterium]|nr:glycosyltransferase family 39 protein [Vicinamibacteria bacterium]
MFHAVVLIPALCLWTGQGILRLTGHRLRGGELASGLFLAGTTGVLAIGWIALLAAQLRVFSALAVASAGLLIGGLGLLIRRDPRRLTAAGEGGRRPADGALLIALIALTGLLYLRPHQFIFGAADAGVYVNLGAQIARSGAWLTRNPDLAALSRAEQPMFLRELPSDQIPRYIHLPGFAVADDGSGTIVPQFYPLHAVWLALAWGLGGVRAALCLTPLWGLLGVLALFFAVRAGFGSRVASVAAGLLAITPTQIWFSRYPTAEPLTQFLLFAGLYAFVRFASRGGTWLAALAGLALGQLTLVRIDTGYVVAIVLLYGAWLRLRRRLDGRFWAVAAPMLLMTAHSVVHAIAFGWPYVHNTLSAVSGLTAHGTGIAALAATAALVGLVMLDREHARLGRLAARLRPHRALVSAAAAAALLALAAYAYFLLPLRADPSRTIFYWYGRSTIPDVEPYNFVRLGWYLSPLGLGLGVVGLAALLRRRLRRGAWLMLAVGLFSSVLFVARTFNNPHHVYVMRRYVPAVVPTFALGMAIALRMLSRRGIAGRLAAGSLGLVELALLLHAGRFMNPQVDFAGGVPQFAALADAVPNDAVVIFNDTQPVGAAALFGTPLAYVAGHTVFALQENRIELRRLDALVARWLAASRPVVVIDGPFRAPGLCDRWQCQPRGSAHFDLPVLEPSYAAFPRAVLRLGYKLDLHRVRAVARR